MGIIIDLLVIPHVFQHSLRVADFHKNFALHTFTDISNSSTTENSVHISKTRLRPYYFGIKFRTFFIDNFFSKEWPVDVKKNSMAARSPDLQLLNYVFMGHIKMCTQSTAFKVAVQLRRKKGQGRMLSGTGERVLQP